MKQNNQTYANIRKVMGLISLSLAVYLGFRYFICDEGDLACVAPFDLAPMIVGALIMLVAVIAIAAAVAITFKLLRRSSNGSSHFLDNQEEKAGPQD